MEQSFQTPLIFHRFRKGQIGINTILIIVAIVAIALLLAYLGIKTGQLDHTDPRKLIPILSK